MHRLVTTTALCLLAATAQADWTVAYLHPDGAIRSQVRAIENGVAVGYTNFGAVPMAGLWNGSAASWTSLVPPGATSYSWAHAIHNGVIGGDAVVNGVQQASLWNGTAGSWVSLNPTGSPMSRIDAIDDHQQGGMAVIGGIGRAVVWNGTADSMVDLHPVVGAFEESWVLGVHNGQQVGITIDANTGLWEAALWNGTADSYVNLNPAAGGESDAVAVYNGFQYGGAEVGGTWRASRWNGSAESWVDLNPEGALSSFILAAHDGVQAGQANIRGSNHASLWFDSADSWIDLHALLDGNHWGMSVAFAVWTDGNMIYAGGEAFNTQTRQFEAVMWTIPTPGSMSALALAGLVATRRRRR